MSADDLNKWADQATVIRVSSLSSYGDCQRRAAARLFWRHIANAGYVLRYTPTSIAAVIGTAVHKAASTVLGIKARTGSLPLRTVAIENAREALSDAVDGIELQFDPPAGPTHSMRDATDQVVRMSAIFHDNIAPTINPVLVETRLEAEVETGLILSGQADNICQEPGSIRDLKTGARQPSSWAAQIGGYSLLSRSHGYKIERGVIDFVARISPRKPQPLPVTTEAVLSHAETAASHILRRMAFDLATFRDGDPARRLKPGDSWAFMANPSSRLCSAKYCPAHSTEFCHEWKQHE
jgi:hypothetical protein